MPTRRAASPAPLSAASPNSIPTLIDFIYSVPSPVTTELAALSPHIAYIRHALEITSWKSHWTESWLALAAWWAVCLLAYPGLKYFLPILLVSALVLSRRLYPPSARPSPLITEKNLQSTISNLTAIHALLPHFPPSPSQPIQILLRIAVLTYIPYLLLTFFVSLRVLLGISGTILLTWRSSWAETTRHMICNSAHIRWGTYRLSSYLTGTPLPPMTLSIQTQQTAASTAASNKKPGNTVRFLFTIYENQRWWMGLDWTAALLPAERPSWCSASQTAVSPPNTFSLPEPAISFLPTTNGTASVTGTAGKDEKTKKGSRVKRTARWSWEETEWKVMVRRDGNAGLSRVGRPLPNDEKDTSGQASGSASRIFKGVGKRRESSEASSVGKGVGEDGAEGEPYEGGEEEDGLAVVTDSDGWVYGDNKWEGGSAKGGLGKYTRYRRWTRVAVLTETVEIVDAGDYGVLQINTDTDFPVSPQSHNTSPPSPSLSLPPTPTSPTHSKPMQVPGVPSGTDQISRSPSSQESQSSSRGMLRQRLKAAIEGVQ